MTGRYMIIQRGEYSDAWTVLVRIPKSLSRDVLEAWIDGPKGASDNDPRRGDAWPLAIVDGVEWCGVDIDSASADMFHDDFAETAVAMINAGVEKEDAEP